MIEEYNDKNRIPQVQGGQGRTDEETEGASWIALYVVIGCVALLCASMSFGGC